jgi:hypothetical protein
MAIGLDTSAVEAPQERPVELNGLRWSTTPREMRHMMRSE